MTEAEIIKILARSIDNRKYPFQIPNAFIYSWESDYWVLDAYGITKEFEIKCSRADFFNDAKKHKHSNCEEGANFFYYVCPKGMIDKEEVPKPYGLMYVHEGWVSIEKKPRRLNDNKFDGWKQLANKMYWRWQSLWRQKYIDKEITHEQYREAFNLELEMHQIPDPTK